MRQLLFFILTTQTRLITLKSGLLNICYQTCYDDGGKNSKEHVSLSITPELLYCSRKPICEAASYSPK